MRVDALDKPADLIIEMFDRPNPVVGGVIVTDLGLINGTQQVQVWLRESYVSAIYLPAKAVMLGGNCFLIRLGPDEDMPWLVIATNYQVNYQGGWGGGVPAYSPPPSGPASGYDPGTVGGRPAVTTVGQYGWGDQPWGE